MKQLISFYDFMRSTAFRIYGRKVYYLHILLALFLIAIGLTNKNSAKLKTELAPRSIVSLQLADSPEKADGLIRSWNFQERIKEQGTTTFSKSCDLGDCINYQKYAIESLWWDYFLMFTYLLLGLFLIMQARHWFGDPEIKAGERDWGNFLAQVLCTFVVLAVLADVIENALSISLVYAYISTYENGNALPTLGGITDSVTWIHRLAIFKLIGLAMAMLYFLLSILFKFSQELWAIFEVIRKYCLLSVFSILLLYMLFWGQPQGQDLLISLNENPAQVGLTLLLVFVMAIIAWISPRFFILKFQMKDSWDKMDKSEAWGKRMWNFYIRDFKKNFEYCRDKAKSKEHEWIDQLYLNIPRLLGVFSILIVYGAFRNVLDITHTPLFSSGFSMETLLSPGQQVMAWMFIFGYFLYNQVPYNRKLIITIVSVISILLVVFFAIDLLYYRGAAFTIGMNMDATVAGNSIARSLKGIHLLSLTTLGVAILFFIFVTYRRQIFGLEKIEARLKRMMAEEEVSSYEINKDNAYSNYGKERELTSYEKEKMAFSELKKVMDKKYSNANSITKQWELSLLKVRSNLAQRAVATYILIGLAIALIFFMVVHIYDPLLASNFGTLATVLGALIIYVSAITVLLFIYGHGRIPSLITLFVPILYLIISTVFFSKEYYDVQIVDKKTDHPRVSLEEYFENWVEARKGEILDSTKTNYPLYFVASNGGGSRAAYWTTMLLAYLDDNTDGEFARHLFASSGASGGSVGASVFTALSAYNANKENGRDSLIRIADNIYQDDYLSATVAAVFGRAAFARFLGLKNRSRNLGDQYETNIGNEMDSINYYDQTYYDLYYNKDGSPKSDVPLYFGNTIQIEDGRRGIASPVKMVDDIFVNAVDVLDMRDTTKTLKLSSGAMLTNRFPFLNPVGRIYFKHNQQGHFADGGYFDNTGAVTLYEVLKEVKRVRTKMLSDTTLDQSLTEALQKLEFNVIKIDNDEGTDKKGQPKKPSSASPVSQASAPVTAITQALLVGRVSYADDLLKQEAMNGGDECNYYHMWLPYSSIYTINDCKGTDYNPKGECNCDDRDNQKIIPLGRFLSKAARVKIFLGVNQYSDALEDIIEDLK